MSSSPVDDRVSELRPGIWRLRAELPGHSLGHVNSYALVCDDGVLLVDVGWSSSRDELCRLLTAIGRTPADVRGIVVTHSHADHCGLAASLQREFGTWIAMHAADADDMAHRYFDLDGQVEQTEEWLAQIGAPGEASAAVTDHVHRLARGIGQFSPDRRLISGDVIEFGPYTLTAIHTPGHTPGHCCFSESSTGVLFSGDHVFARINVGPSYRPGASADPVGDYLASLDRLAALDVTVCLPGHQDAVDDLSTRIDELRDYHSRRLSNVERSLRPGGATVWEIASSRQRHIAWANRPWPARITALAEVHAHLLHLERAGTAGANGQRPQRWAVTSG